MTRPHALRSAERPLREPPAEHRDINPRRRDEPSPAWARVCDLAAAVTEIDAQWWAALASFDDELTSAVYDDHARVDPCPVSGHPGGPSAASLSIPAPRHAPPVRSVSSAAPPHRLLPSPTDVEARSARLLALRRAFAPGTVPMPGTADERRQPPVDAAGAVLAQTLRQFLAGYHDLDLRDVSGPGHGRMILRHAPREVAAQWAARLDAGELAGAAMTEARGGSRLSPPQSRLVPDGPSRWRLRGHKRWISRLDEASVFVVSAADPDRQTTAVLVDADSAGLHRHRHEPAGLSGWSWGELTFDDVAVDARDLLTHRVPPAGVFADHFALYRQLVTATALGAAYGVHDAVRGLLRARLDRGEIARPGDHALIALADADTALRAALLATLHTARLAARSDPAAVARSAAAKAHGVETARHHVDQLAALAGAVGFTRTHPIAKTRNDLEALRFADGAHDSLRRHAGAHLLSAAPPRTT